MTDERVLTYCEIDVSPCSLIYGTAPCVAALGVTGPIKCFNTRFTCQDPDHFSPVPVTLRFAVDAAYLPVDIPAIPSILSVEFTPGRISLGKDLGQRSSAKVVFKDHPWGDAGPGYDKYVAQRPYDAFEQGTYWGKAIARRLFKQGAAIRLITGFLGQTLAEMVTYHLVIDGIDGPSPGDTCTVVAKDILKLADGDKSLTPPLSNGYLAADINSSQTTAVLAPSGIGGEYPASGHVTIGGNETCAFTRTGDNLTITRGAKGTPASAHSAEDRVQLMRSWVAAKPSEVFRNLFQDDCGIDSSWIPVSEWQAEENTFLQLTYTRDVAEPTASSKIAADLIEQAQLAVYPDSQARKIRMQVLRGVSGTAVQLSPDNIIENSLKVRAQPDARISQVHVRYGLRNPLLRGDDRLSYRSVLKGVDATSDLYWTSPAIREVNGTFLPAFAAATAKRPSDVLLGRNVVPPRVFSFSLSRRGPIMPELGQDARLTWPPITQLTTGAGTDTPVMIVRVNPTGRRIEVEAEEMLAPAFNPADSKNRVLLIKTNEKNLNIPALHNAAYPALTAQDVIDGVNLLVIIETSATVGSNAATAAGIAMHMGTTGVDWPAGFQIKLRAQGRLRGKGGDAGRGADANTANYTSGEAGGTALYVRHPITIELYAGAEIMGGGGGGGGGGAYHGVYGSQHYYAPGGGGGGGAGAVVGAGGFRGWGFVPASFGSPGTLSAGGAGGGAGRGEIGGNVWGTAGGPGGAGGAPGAAGASGGRAGVLPTNGLGAGGAAGRAIDGISYCTFAINAGTRAGPEVN
jgi:hypothetical protein